MGRRLSFALAGVAVVTLTTAAFAATRTGGPGADRLAGTENADSLSGRGGADVISGGRGEDRLIGGGGDDVLRGGPDRDEFNMRRGAELASPGDDRVLARDGGADEIACGAGRDVAVVDAVEDGVYGCERILEP